MSLVNFTPSASRCSDGDLLVEPLGEHVHAKRILLDVAEQLHLSDHLVAERATHHEARVASGAAEVHQTTLGQHDDGVPVGERPQIRARLQLVVRGTAACQAGHVDLAVEVADVADDRVVLHLHACDRR